jgi:4-amino-4-deoxy-L-arabinose transferase-like glycosyltransferase
MKKHVIILIAVILLASALRLWQLGSVPISMSDDEIRLIYSGYSIAHTGRDAFGNFLPLVFHMDGASTYGQIPIYITSIFFLFLKLSPFTARLPFALSGILSVAVLYFILRKILDNNTIALLSSFVLSVSVWSLQMTRFAIEIDMAVLMYLLGILLFLYAQKRTSLFLLSMVFFCLGFYTYAAVKIILIPILIILAWYNFKTLTRKHFFIILATIVLAFGSFWFLSITQGGASYAAANGSFFFFQDKATTSQAVELERRASQEPNIIKSLYHNKFTYWLRVASSNYLTTFSPQYLFLSQEANGIYSIWGRGELYVFELPLCLLGAFYLFLKKRKEFLLILGLLLVSPLPSALGIGAPTWTSRAGFTLFWLCAFVGAGIYFLLTFFKKRNYRYLVFVLIAIFYLYAVVGYLSQYYFDWSRTNAKYFSKSTKDLVYKIDSYRVQNKAVVVSGATVNTFMHYAFYNQLDPKLVQANINKTPIRFANFTFQENCLVDIPKNLTYISSINCKYKQKPTSQIKEYDSPETAWNIYAK